LFQTSKTHVVRPPFGSIRFHKPLDARLEVAMSPTYFRLPVPPSPPSECPAACRRHPARQRSRACRLSRTASQIPRIVSRPPLVIIEGYWTGNSPAASCTRRVAPAPWNLLWPWLGIILNHAVNCMIERDQ